MTALARRFANPLGAAVALSVILIALTVVVAATPAGARWNADVQLFHHYAGTFLNGYVAETPFLSWYPPLSLVPIVVPRLVAPGLGLYSFLFGIEMSVVAGVGLLVAIQVERRWGRDLRAPGIAWTFAGLVLLAGFVLPWRFDILPAVLVLGAIAAALDDRPILAGTLLGLGAALKLYPAAAVPALVAWFWARRKDRAALAAIGAFFLVAAAGMLLYIAFPPVTPLDLLRFQSDRGLQIESTAGSLLALAASLGWVPRPSVAYTDGSFNVTSDAAASLLGWLTGIEAGLVLLALALLAWVAVGARKGGQADSRTLVRGMLALLLAVMVTNRVLSVQYLIWVLPFVAVIAGVPRLLGIAAAVLTAALLPFLYNGVLALDPVPLVILVIRNLCLIALLGWAFAVLFGGTVVTTRPNHDQLA